MCVLIQNTVTLSKWITVEEYTVKEDITKLPKEESPDMLLHVCLQLIRPRFHSDS